MLFVFISRGVVSRSIASLTAIQSPEVVYFFHLKKYRWFKLVRFGCVGAGRGGGSGGRCPRVRCLMSLKDLRVTLRNTAVVMLTRLKGTILLLSCDTSSYKTYATFCSFDQSSIYRNATLIEY